MTGNDIAMRLQTILSIYVLRDCSDLPPTTHIVRDLGLDSLDLVQIAITIEEEFGIEISDDKVMELATVGQLTEYIASRIKVQNGQ